MGSQEFFKVWWGLYFLSLQGHVCCIVLPDENIFFRVDTLDRCELLTLLPVKFWVRQEQVFFPEPGTDIIGVAISCHFKKLIETITVNQQFGKVMRAFSLGWAPGPSLSLLRIVKNIYWQFTFRKCRQPFLLALNVNIKFGKVHCFNNNINKCKPRDLPKLDIPLLVLRNQLTRIASSGF